MERDRGGRPRHPDILTPAEWRVLEELRKGGTNAEIAVRLGVSPDAVKYHISNMLGKLDLQNRHELGAWQPAARGGRLRALFATPVSLALFGRPLVWAGAGAVALTGVAAVIVLSVILQGNGEPEPIALPPATPADTPTPGATATTATSPTATTEATATLSPTVACGNPSTAPNLVMFSDGSATDLVIEWTGGPRDATGWQYRTRVGGTGTSNTDLGWGERRADTTRWTDIPTGTARTCSHRITGLRPRNPYEAQVRAALPGGAHGVESNVAGGFTQYDDGRTPKISRDAIVKGDGSTRWRIHELSWTFIIPEGVLIRGAGISFNGVTRVGIFDYESGSSLGFWTYGVEIGRRVFERGRDVAALFDQIVASVDAPVQQLTPAQYATFGSEHSGYDAWPVAENVVHIRTSGEGTFELTIPAGARLDLRGPYCHPRPECFEPGSAFVLTMIAVSHVDTGSELVVVIEHIGPDGLITDGPWEVSRVVTVHEARADVNAVFDAVVASLRRVQEPSATSE